MFAPAGVVYAGTLFPQRRLLWLHFESGLILRLPRGCNRSKAYRLLWLRRRAGPQLRLCRGRRAHPPAVSNTACCGCAGAPPHPIRRFLRDIGLLRLRGTAGLLLHLRTGLLPQQHVRGRGQFIQGNKLHGSRSGRSEIRCWRKQCRRYRILYGFRIGLREVLGATLEPAKLLGNTVIKPLVLAKLADQGGHLILSRLCVAVRLRPSRWPEVDHGKQKRDKHNERMRRPKNRSTDLSHDLRCLSKYPAK